MKQRVTWLAWAAALKAASAALHAARAACMGSTAAALRAVQAATLQQALQRAPPRVGP